MNTDPGISRLKALLNSTNRLNRSEWLRVVMLLLSVRQAPPAGGRASPCFEVPFASVPEELIRQIAVKLPLEDLGDT
jgi:hypothetical protein